MSARAAARLESLGFQHVYRYTPGMMDWLANELPSDGDEADATRIGDLARRDVPACRLDDTAGVVRERMGESDSGICFVATDDGVVLGLLRAANLGTLDDGEPIEHVMEPGPVSYRPSAEPGMVLEYMRKSDTDPILVTTTEGRLIGRLTRSDAERALDT